MSQAEEARPKILVVDDSRVMRLSARKILEQEFELVLEEDGLSAWERLQQDADILAVFSDVGMPGLDGHELLDKIRGASDSRLKEIPVIIVTGNDDEGARDEALDRGATDFITKPFDRAQLLARARANANRDRMRRRANELEASNLEDPVTGLGNRRYFERRLREARANALRHDRPMALLRLDVIDFDTLVEKRGKRVAVDVLREAGEALTESLREEDVVSRLGGARFAVICPDCDRPGARALGDRIVETLDKSRFAGEHKIQAAAAIGIYLPSDDPGEKLEVIYKAVQKALGEALSQGGGSIVCHPEKEEDGQDDAAAKQEEKLVTGIRSLLAKVPSGIATRVLKRLQREYE